MRARMVCSAVLLFLFCRQTAAQQSSLHGWLVANHEHTLSSRWKLVSQVQLRSAKNLRQTEVVLVRPGIRYQLPKGFNATVGYAYLGNWEAAEGNNLFEPEHRAWEQLMLVVAAGKTQWTQYLRLEQRFLDDQASGGFAQRLRYSVQYERLLLARGSNGAGVFSILQNEIFFTIQNKEAINGSFFDQNRAYLGFGYRFGKTVDVEAGYLYRYQLEEEGMHHHILQITLSTSF